MASPPAVEALPGAPGMALRALQRVPTADLEALLGVRLLPPVLRHDPDRDRAPLPSHTATWREVTRTTTGHHVHTPALATGWSDAWSVTYRHGLDEHTSSVREVSPIDLLDADPARNSTWHKNSRARAGLRFLSTTGRLHWHESLFERDLLVALDFEDGLDDVASQPFTLTWHDGGAWRSHTPDFAAVIDGEMWVINVRPAARVTARLLANAAAVREVCDLRGWREAVVIGYQRPALTVLETVGAARGAADPYGLAGQMLDILARRGPSRFGNVITATRAPALARAVLQRLLWERKVTTDLNRMLTDETLLAVTGPAAVTA